MSYRSFSSITDADSWMNSLCICGEGMQLIVNFGTRMKGEFYDEIEFCNSLQEFCKFPAFLLFSSVSVLISDTCWD